MPSRLPRILYGVYALAVMGLCMLVVFFPLIILAPTQAWRRQVGRAGMRVTLALIGVSFRVSGVDRLPAGACVAVANHASYLDGLVLTAALPGRFHFVVKDDAAQAPYVGLMLRRMGVIFISRTDVRSGSRQMLRLIRLLEEGESLAMFPEGTFGRDPGLLRFRDGAFLVAARANVPVVPVTIRGTRRLLGDGQWLPQRSALTVDILPPLTSPPAAEPRAAAHALRAAAREAILAQCGEPDLAHAG